MTEQYHLVFRGETTADKDLDTVKKNMSTMLKIDPNRTARLFSGQAVVLRKNIDPATAEKYRKLFENMGVVCEILPASGGAEERKPGPGEPGQPQPGRSDVPLPGSMKEGDMVLTNVESVPGRSIAEHFGLVSGSTIRAKHVGRDIMAGLKNLVGGELKGYTQLLQESRQEAVDRMIEQAKALGANAIVNVRFSTSSVAQGAAELYAYGTAVRIE